MRERIHSHAVRPIPAFYVTAHSIYRFALTEPGIGHPRPSESRHRCSSRSSEPRGRNHISLLETSPFSQESWPSIEWCLDQFQTRESEPGLDFVPPARQSCSVQDALPLQDTCRFEYRLGVSPDAADEFGGAHRPSCVDFNHYCKCMLSVQKIARQRKTSPIHYANLSNLCGPRMQALPPSAFSQFGG